MAISFAEAGDLQADTLMEKKEAIVLDKEILENLEISGVDIEESNFLQTFGNYQTELKLQYIPLKKLIKGISSIHSLIEENSLTKKESLFVNILQKICWDLNYIQENYAAPKRKIRVGISQTTDGWTDGKSYIAINKEFLKANLAGSPTNMGNLVLLLIHEHCHNESDEKTHTHSPEFYKTYHDLTLHAPKLQMQAFCTLIKKLEEMGKTLPSNIQKSQLQISLAQTHGTNKANTELEIPEKM